MVDEYQEWEESCKRVRKVNARLLSEFKEWLLNKRLSEKTIKEHLYNVDFYINEYLLYHEVIEAKDGAVHIEGFLGDWFIKKAMWATESSIKKNAASLKKFYQFMYQNELVEEYDIQYVRDGIREDMPEWLAALRHFDDLAKEPW